MNKSVNPPPTNSLSNQNCLILLVEDSPVNQQVGALMLQQLGYEKIDIANNGLEAIERVQHKNYDVIFMDLKMPVLDGISATKEIRNLKNLIQQPWIIAMTATVLPEIQDASLESGMNDYITKPIQLNNLQRALARYTNSISRNE